MGTCVRRTLRIAALLFLFLQIYSKKKKKKKKSTRVLVPTKKKYERNRTHKSNPVSTKACTRVIVPTRDDSCFGHVFESADIRPTQFCHVFESANAFLSTTRRHPQYRSGKEMLTRFQACIEYLFQYRYYYYTCK